jgi:hypothetical protein
VRSGDGHATRGCAVDRVVIALGRAPCPTDYGNTESALVGSVCGWLLNVRRTLADAL